MTDIVLRIQSEVGQAIADVQKFRASISSTDTTVAGLGATYKDTTVAIIAATKEQITAEKAKVDQYRSEQAALRELTATYAAGSDERRISTQMEIALQAKLQAALGETAVDTRTAAEMAITGEKAKIDQYRREISALQALTSTYQRGSDERRIATQMEIDLQHKLQIALGETAATAGKSGAKNTERDLSGLGRGAASRSGVAGTGMAALAGPGFIVGAVVGGVLDAGVKAAKEEEIALGNLQNALKDTGQARKISQKQLEEYLVTEEHATGFQRDQVSQTLSQLIRSTGSLSKARHEEAVMADVARARNTDLAGAMMLVMRAAQGNTGSLKRLGIDIPKVTTEEDKLKAAHLTGNVALEKRAKALDLAATKSEVMHAVTQKFAGASARYMHTFGGETAALSNNWHDLEVAIGQKAIPELSKLIGWINKEITGLEHNHKLLGEAKTAYHLVSGAISAVTKAGGGFVHILELLAGLYATRKIIGYATALQTNLSGAYDGVSAAVNRFRDTNAEADAVVAADNEAAALKSKEAMLGSYAAQEAGAKAMVVANAEADAAIVADAEAAGLAVDAAFPWALIIQAAVIAAIEIIQHWSTIKRWMIEFGKWISDHAYVLFAVPIVGQAAFVVVEVIKHFKQIKSFVLGVWKAIEKAFDWLVNKIIDQLNGIINGYNKVAGWLSGNIPAIGHIGSKAGDAYGKGFASAAEKHMKGIGKGDLQGMQGPAGPGGPTNGSGGGSSSNRLSSRLGSIAREYGPQSGGVGGTGGHGGIVKPGTALDCSGFVREVYMRAGFKDFPETSETQWGTKEGTNWVSRRISMSEATEGDVVFMVGSGFSSPGHVGLITNGSGSGATMMAYSYKSGEPPYTQKLGTVNDLVGIKRFYLRKDSPTGGGSSTKPKKGGGTSKSSYDAAVNAAEAAAEKAKGAKAPTLIGIKAAIDRELASLPKDLDPVEKEAVRHLEALKAALHVGMSPAELARDKAAIAKWSTTLKDELKKQAASLRQVAQDAAATWTAGFALDTAKIERAISEQWDKIKRKFDQKTQAGLQKFVVAQTPQEKALADYQAQIAARQEAQTKAQEQSELAAAIAAGDTVRIKAAQDAINQTLQQDQLNALQAAADASRKAADAKTAKLQQDYQDQRDKQWQHLQDMHDDQVAMFDEDLKLWQRALLEKKRAWKEFIQWLRHNPVSAAINPGNAGVSNPNDYKAPSIDHPHKHKHHRKNYAGGVHLRPTVEMFGEQGPEATVPLTGQAGQAAINQLARAIVEAAGRGPGGSGGDTIIYGTFLGATEKQVGRALEGLVTPAQSRVARYKAPF